MSVHKKYISGCSGIPQTLLWSIINRGTRTDPEHPTPNMINPSSRCHFLKIEYQVSITINLIFLKQKNVQESDTIWNFCIFNVVVCWITDHMYSYMYADSYCVLKTIYRHLHNTKSNLNAFKTGNKRVWINFIQKHFMIFSKVPS